VTTITFDRARAARPFVWLAMPILAVVNQYLAERTAQALQGEAFGFGWVAHVIGSPWARGWVGCELLTFPVWMVVLANLSLSAAFPMTALGYVLVIGLGWTVFHEPVTAVELIGGAAILAGVRLLGEGEASS
jgi:multidrug transporter EmrE-like cation transporter